MALLKSAGVEVPNDGGVFSCGGSLLIRLPQSAASRLVDIGKLTCFHLVGSAAPTADVRLAKVFYRQFLLVSAVMRDAKSKLIRLFHKSSRIEVDYAR